jgi:amidohydrolase
MNKEPRCWFDAAKELLPGTIALRRHIHEHPELGLDLPQTTQAVLDCLKGLDIEIDRGPSTSGLVVKLNGAREGATILLRGDMDALPMREETGLPYASKEPGRMHACGHDAHTAMLVGAAKLLHRHRERLAGTVKFMFQPGEEGHFGARKMIDDGLIEKAPRPDAAFALHVNPNLPSGVITSKPGAIMASTDEVKIVVWGKGGHAAMPFLALDPIPVACEIVTALQALVTRRINPFDPVILTIGKIESGTAKNVIPETASLLGTLRSLSERSRHVAKEGIVRVATKVAEAHGARAEVNLTPGYNVTVNDPRMVSLAARAAQSEFGERGYAAMSAPMMGGEDWCYVLERIPGCMAFLGAAPRPASHRDAAPIHSNHMLIDEDAMAAGIAMHAAVAERFLSSGFGES